MAECVYGKRSLLSNYYSKFRTLNYHKLAEIFHFFLDLDNCCLLFHEV